MGERNSIINDINYEFLRNILKIIKKELITMQNKFNSKRIMIEKVYQKTANKVKYNNTYFEHLEILKELK